MAKSHKVLIVEDEEALREVFTTILEKEHFDVTAVADGKEAIKVLETTPHDIILLDLLMPVMDGKAFLKKFDNEQQIPIIVFSNLDTKNDIEEVEKLGASRYVLKAWVSPRELVRIVRSSLNEEADHH